MSIYKDGRIREMDWVSAIAGTGDAALDAPDITDPVLGQFERDGDRIWQRVHITHGKGQWAYWVNREHYQVCADTIFNSDAPHFAGYLVKPHSGLLESTEWLLIEPQLRPRIPRPLYIEDIERREGRYERNDVDRIQKGPKTIETQEDR